MKLEEMKVKITVDTTDLDVAEVKLDRLLDKAKKLKEVTEYVALIPTPQMQLPIVIAPGVNMDEIIDEIMRRLKDAIKNIGPELYT